MITEREMKLCMAKILHHFMTLPKSNFLWLYIGVTPIGSQIPR